MVKGRRAEGKVYHKDAYVGHRSERGEEKLKSAVGTDRRLRKSPIAPSGVDMAYRKHSWLPVEQRTWPSPYGSYSMGYGTRKDPVQEPANAI